MSNVATTAVSTTATAASNASVFAQLAQIQAQLQAQNDALNTQGSAQTSSAVGTVQNFTKSTAKSVYNTVASATDIGTVTKGQTRVNAFGSLAAGDQADYLSFKLSRKSAINLGLLDQGKTRLQVMNKTGTVLADSDSKSGKAYDAFTSMINGQTTLDAGTYVLKVSRATGTKLTEKVNYGVQVAAGDYSKDYTTTVTAASTSASISPNAAAISNALSDQLTTMKNWTIGQTGTQKLMGSMINLFA
ncbi:hypothetical protein [Nitrospirillum iridis]|uniref:Uncharacterized protein n=1 Tax=Nitrospirillum iridis TaxID=765888 RepID=A0A7X0AW13_9PROT|nr:hypothetical protein [Nitrospirillum iridis]MBB6251167.1 hypothetical protein [Nitrospirillum iridis]